MAGIKRSITYFLLAAFIANTVSVFLLGNAWATSIPYGEISRRGDAFFDDANRLDAVMTEIVARPDLPEGPAHIEGADYYLHEIIRDENWEQWAQFKATSRTIIPMASARFFVYANLALSKLKKPGVLVIMERKAPERTAPKTLFKRIKRSRETLETIGLVQRGDRRQKDKGWDLGSIFDVDTEVTVAVDREWDFWFVSQKLLFVGVWIVGGLIFVEVLRLVFGAGARVLASGARRRDTSQRRKRKKRA